jgi:hypothetical protein
MLGIEEAVQKADRDGLDTSVPQNADRIADSGLVERGFDAPVVAQSFRHLPAQPALDQNGRFVRLQIIEVGPLLPADFEKVAEAVAGDQPSRRTAMLDQRIGRNCRPMAKIGDIACRRRDPGQRFANPFCERLRRVAGGRRNLPHRD